MRLRKTVWERTDVEYTKSEAEAKFVDCLYRLRKLPNKELYHVFIGKRVWWWQ